MSLCACRCVCACTELPLHVPSGGCALLHLDRCRPRLLVRQRHIPARACTVRARVRHMPSTGLPCHVRCRAAVDHVAKIGRYNRAGEHERRVGPACVRALAFARVRRWAAYCAAAAATSSLPREPAVPAMGRPSRNREPADALRQRRLPWGSTRAVQPAVAGSRRKYSA